MISGQWGDEHSQVFVTKNHKENVLKNQENELYFTLQNFYNCAKEAPRIINTIYILKSGCSIYKTPQPSAVTTTTT